MLLATAVVALTVVALDARSRLMSTDGELLSVSAPVGTADIGAFFRSLHGLVRSPLPRLLRGQPWIAVQYAARVGRIEARLWVPRRERAFIESQLRAVCPAVVLTAVPPNTERTRRRVAAIARLVRDQDLPIRTSFDGDPLAGILWTLARTPADAEVEIELMVRPRESGWQARALRRAQRLRDCQRLDKSLFRPARVLGPSQADREKAKAIEAKAAHVGFDCVLRVSASAPSRRAAHQLIRSIGAALAEFADANRLVLRTLVLPRAWDAPAAKQRKRRFPLAGRVFLTTPELSGLWHMPREAPPQLEVLRSPRLPPPKGTSLGSRVLGVANWADAGQRVALTIPDSRYHLHLLGSTGTGKTTALLNLGSQDIAAGRGVAVLDPKGDLVRGLLDRIPSERVNDVVLISPDDSATSVAINPLQLWPGDDRDLVAENTLTIFKRVYERYWGPRTDDVLKAALLTLLRLPGATLAQIPVLLTNEAFRRSVLRDLRDPLGLDGFWVMFERMTDAQRRDAIGPVLNKLRDFLLRERLRRVLCSPESTVDLRRVIDDGQILLVDLSVGRWGETAASLIGSFLVARIWQAALARSVIAEDERRDFFLYVDEFQHFLGISGPFADVLAEARSLRLALTLANQHLGQLTKDLRDALASNARSRLVFQCGQDDAAYLAREFAPLDPVALMSLGRFEAAARIASDGQSSRPFTLRTLPPSRLEGAADAGAVRLASAERFGRPILEIDRDLELAIGLNPQLPAAEREGSKVRGGADHEPKDATASPPGDDSALVPPESEVAVNLTEIRAESVVTTPTGPAGRSPLSSVRESQAVLRLAWFGWLTSAHLGDFLCASTSLGGRSRVMTANRILRRLRERGLVASQLPSVGGSGGGSGRVVHHLTDAGYRQAERLDPTLERVSRPTRAAAPVEHSLMTADVARAFARSAELRDGHELRVWEPDRVAAMRLGAAAVVPDGRLVYVTPTWELDAFIEIDRGTEAPSRFADKIAGYLEAFRSGSWQAHLSRWPLVLTVTLTAARSDALVRIAEHALQTADPRLDLSAVAFDFAALPQLLSDGPIGTIWRVALRPGLHHLAPSADTDALRPLYASQGRESGQAQASAGSHPSGRFSVYAVELRDPRDTTGCEQVYVGSTVKSPASRLTTHRAGGRTSNERVRQYGTRLRPDLTAGLGPYRTREQAEAAETALRRRLEQAGWVVYGGTGRTLFEDWRGETEV